MVVSCFFCQNLLSDYIEGILPSARHEELKKHLSTCAECSGVHGDLQSTLQMMQSLPSRGLSHDMALRITEASHAGHLKHFYRSGASRWMMLASIPLLLFLTLVFSFPQLFPWFTELRNSPDDSQFVRYFPILQGAQDILEEQSSWLFIREPATGSLWEEGGMSPEEFEKSFQIKAPRTEVVQ